MTEPVLDDGVALVLTPRYCHHPQASQFPLIGRTNRGLLISLVWQEARQSCRWDFTYSVYSDILLNILQVVLLNTKTFNHRQDLSHVHPHSTWWGGVGAALWYAVASDIMVSMITPALHWKVKPLGVSENWTFGGVLSYTLTHAGSVPYGCGHAVTWHQPKHCFSHLTEVCCNSNSITRFFTLSFRN